MFCPTVLQPPEEVAFWNVSESPVYDEPADSPSVLAERRIDLRVGLTTYRLTRPVRVNWMPAGEGWICYIDDLIGYAGRAGTRQEAFRELKVRLHTDFQTLQRKRPFEMSQSQRDKWLELTSVIDLLHYRTNTPIVTREIGQVSFGRISRPRRIKWISGQNYLIEVENVPGELMSCVPGQWVEADVKRDPIHNRILAIESIRKISFRLPTETELKSMWENMPKAEVEAAGWTW